MHEPKERLQKNILIMVFENLIFNIGTNVALAYNVKRLCDGGEL